MWLEQVKGTVAGEELGGVMEDHIMGGPAGRREDLGFSSERNGEPVQGWEQRNSTIRVTF